jgi:UDP-MurNAc hydroxylase
MTEVEWINHASYLMRVGDISLVCDPWLEGTAFKDGWSHISRTAFGYDRFSGVTHIWISHQHPDHFAPISLKNIPKEDRARIVVLYQETDDKLVVSWLRSNGFRNTKEVQLRRWLPLAPDIDIQVGTLFDDSWLALRHDGRIYLNVNDCVLKTPERIQEIADHTGKVDVLFTQFSYAQWIGNPGDTELRRQDAREKYDRLRMQNEIFDPKYIVPFASYIYFCHEENFFMNDSVNRVADVASHIETSFEKTPVVLYPGETWHIDGAAPDWRPSARRYGEDLDAKIAGGPTQHVNRLQPSDVADAIDGFLRRLARKNPIAPLLLSGQRTTVYLTDAGQAYELTSRGIRSITLSERETDISTSAENVLYAFRTPWGGNTLHVSGRFTSYVPGAHLRFFNFMHQLHHYNVTPINLQWAQAQGLRAARGIVRRVAARLPSRAG